MIEILLHFKTKMEEIKKLRVETDAWLSFYLPTINLPGVKIKNYYFAEQLFGGKGSKRNVVTGLFLEIVLSIETVDIIQSKKLAHNFAKKVKEDANFIEEYGYSGGAFLKKNGWSGSEYEVFP